MARTQAERTEATRGELVAAARLLFASKGFANTSTEEIVAKAGVTRGALYHHFSGKHELFEAVFRELEHELDAAAIAAARTTTDPWEMVLAGCGACLDFGLRPDYRQIVLADGPAVLGLVRWHTIDAELGLGTMALGVQALMDSGVIERTPVRPLAILLFGALNQASMAIANADDPNTLRAELLDGIRSLLQGMRRPDN